MRKSVAVVLAVAMVGLLGGFVMKAFAAETAKDAKACCSGQGAMTGKVEVKSEKVDGKDVKVPYIKLSADCKTAEGKTCCPNSKGKTVKLVGAKAGDAEKLAGKEVEIKGTCKGGKEIEVASVAEKK